MRTTKLAVLSFAALCATGIAHSSARQQAIQNTSFELTSLDPNTPTLPQDWIQFGNARQSADFAFDSRTSALASVRTNAFVGMFQDTLSVTAGTHVLMQARAYHPSAAPISGNIVAGIKLEFFPPQGIPLPPPEENLTFDETAPLDTWVPVTLTTTVPEGIDIAKIVIISFDEATNNGAVYADSAFAERGSAPGVNQLLNFSFEEGGSGPDGMNPPWDEFADPTSGARKNCFNPTAHHGLCTVRMSGLTTGVAQQITVTPGETLTVRAFFESLAADPYNNPDARAGVKIEWVAGNVPTPNIDIVPNANPISGTTNRITAASPRDQWLPISIDYTMPPQRAALLRATIINAFGPGVCDVYFDAFEMVFTNVFDGSDTNGDNDEDMQDIAQLQRVFAGSGGGLRFGGLVFDQTDDGDVDADDSNFVLDRITGPHSIP